MKIWRSLQAQERITYAEFRSYIRIPLLANKNSFVQQLLQSKYTSTLEMKGTSLD